MNRICRLVWSEVRGAWVAGSKLAQKCGSQPGPLLSRCWPFAALLGLASLAQAAPPAADALPEGGRIMAGSGSISRAGAEMIVQQNTPRLIADWESFDVGSGAMVTFNQPGASSMALNRVLGQDPSLVFGQVKANGHVLLVNPAGIVFGPGSRVNVGGVIASALAIAEADFMAGIYRFRGTGAGEILNQGTVAATNGVAALVAPVVKNEGTISAMHGAALGAGEEVTLDFSGDGLLAVTVSRARLENLAENKGLLRANDGQIVLTAGAASDLFSGVVNNRGIVEAQGLAVQGGRIALTGGEIAQQGELSAEGGSIGLAASRAIYLDGAVDVSDAGGKAGDIALATGKLEGMAGGSLRADGHEGGSIRVEGRGMVAFSSALSAKGTDKGGRIEVTGDSVILLNAPVDASGGSEGGIVHLGGGWQGGGGLPQAREILVGTGSRVAACGNKGGEIAVWSTERSEHDGTLAATTGGRIELSSKGEVRLKGALEAGAGGEVLLDPRNLTITDVLPDNLTMARKVAHGSLGGMPALANSDYFGSAVALDGDRLAVGAYGDDTEGASRGAVHLFTGVGSDFSGLTWHKKLASGTGAAGMPGLANSDQLGQALALDGDRLAVATSNNEVHLFTGVGSDFSGLTWRKELASGAGAAAMPGLGALDAFGSAVALDGDRLAVGASGDGTGGADRGAVHLFTGVGDDFSGLTWQKKMASGIGAPGMPALADNDQFGISAALDGDRLAVGAYGDDSGGASRGAVHLFTGVGSDFSSLTWEKKLTSGAGAAGMPALANSDYFGSAVALDGGRLAVGAVGDDTGGASRGAVHLFTGVGEDFSGLTWRRKLASGIGAAGMPALVNSDLFGGAVALDGDRLAVGANGDDTGGGLRGAVHLFTGMFTLAPMAAGEETFANDPAADSFITPATLTALLDAGTSVTLQANNDITVGSAVTVNNPGGNGGAFTLQAGRHLNFNAGITTDSGNLTAVAGVTGANPAYTDAGTPAITIADGVTLDAGSGSIVLAAHGGNFVNNAGSGALAAGAWQVWSTDPAADTRGGLAYDFKQYDADYGSSAVLGTGNGFLYSLAPLVTASLTGTVTKTYDATAAATLAAGNYVVSGVVDGDSVILNNPAAGTYNNKNAGTGKTVSVSGLAIASAANGATTVYGYQPASNTASAVIGTITAKAITASGITAFDKVYDATTTAALNVNGAALTGGAGAENDHHYYTGDAVTLVTTGAHGSFGDKNAGAGKMVTIASLSLAGADAGSYTVSDASGATAAITAKAIATSGITGLDKVYDATTAAALDVGGAVLAGGAGAENDHRYYTGDAVTLVATGATGTFGDKNAGAGKPVTVAGLALSGADAGNYTVSDASGVTAAIVARTIGLSDLTANNKTYDGKTAATIRSYGHLTGVVAGDAVSLVHGGASASFTDHIEGRGKVVSVTGLELAGFDGGNYQMGPQTTTADITSARKPPLELAPGSVGFATGGAVAGPFLAGGKTGFAGGGLFEPPPVADASTALEGTEMAVAGGVSGSAHFGGGVEQNPVPGEGALLPLFRQEGGTLVPIGSLQVPQHGSQPPATAAAFPGELSFASASDETGMRLVTANLELSDGAATAMTVGITPEGMLVVRAPAELRHSQNEQQLALMALRIAQEQLQVDSASIEAVVLQQAEEMGAGFPPG